jgi:hypothetical protein
MLEKAVMIPHRSSSSHGRCTSIWGIQIRNQILNWRSPRDAIDQQRQGVLCQNHSLSERLSFNFLTIRKNFMVPLRNLNCINSNQVHLCNQSFDLQKVYNMLYHCERKSKGKRASLPPPSPTLTKTNRGPVQSYSWLVS